MKGEPFVLREGFWRNEEPETKGLPRPCARPKPFVGQRAFLAALSCVENHDRTRTSHAKGWSDCRCCGCKNGSAEFKLNALGATWAWPAGYGSLRIDTQCSSLAGISRMDYRGERGTSEVLTKE